ncbi:MAG TPA: hypothetical protein ENJ87_01560 [Gammaproteobacteria bacterium]|nr:hypothetical protein [Gammaproteobacteria bacterium]
MLFKIDKPYENERKLSQSVIQVIELLGMYHAELARILGQQCTDIGELTSGRRCIEKDSGAWHKAKLFIDTYHLLYERFAGDGVAIYHWMRAYNADLDGTPHLLMVDDGKLREIHDYLSKTNSHSV